MNIVTFFYEHYNTHATGEGRGGSGHLHLLYLATENRAKKEKIPHEPH
jgi:hypothetical protein